MPRAEQDVVKGDLHSGADNESKAPETFIRAGEVVLCSECGHSSLAHGVEGCEAKRWACPCPLHPSDILPMTDEQRAEFDRNRYGGRS